MTLSYWQRQAGLPRTHPPLGEPAVMECDICIVGGGIIGSSAAYWAAQRGLRGVVLEARDPALGASGRNAGFILTGVAESYAAAVKMYGRERARELWQVSLDNVALMLNLAESLGVPAQRTGSLILAESEEEAAELQETADLLHADGLPGEYTPYDPIGRGFLAAIARHEDGVTQPAFLTNALLNSTGFTVVPDSPVTAFREEGEYVIVESARITVRTKHLLLATNAYSAQVHPYFQGKVVPMRGQIYITDPLPYTFHTAGYSHYGFWYFRQVQEVDDPSMARWLVGGGRYLHFASENNNPSEMTSLPVQSDLEAWTRRYFPEFADAPIHHRWAGTMGFTDDGLPLVGRLPGFERVAYSVGFNGHGMGLGIKVVERAVDLLLDNKSAGIFAADRLYSVM